jgi:uncharacterized Ntn-hydrolase superfamily protein
MAFAHTFSIVARCASSGEMGVAVQSHWFAVGTVVPWAMAGVGVVATQSMVDPSYGPRGLSAMQAGMSATDALARLVAADPGREVRQIAMLDRTGVAAAWTGRSCVASAAHHVVDGYSVQANMMTDDTICPAMATAFEQTEGPLADRLLAALDAAQAAGGDARGKQSAAMIIVRPESTGQTWLDRLFDLRVDDASDPLIELRRLVGLQRAYNQMNAGDLAMEKQDIPGALHAYRAAEALAPDSAEIVFWHAVAMANAGMSDISRAQLQRCYQMDPRWREMTPRVAAAGLLTKAVSDL